MNQKLIDLMVETEIERAEIISNITPSDEIILLENRLGDVDTKFIEDNLRKAKSLWKINSQKNK